MHFPRFGIRAKLIVYILLLTLCPLAFLGYQAYREQMLVIQEQITRSHRDLSFIIAHGIYEYLDYTRMLMTSISELECIKDLNPVFVEDLFKSLKKQYRFFKQMYLVDYEKKIFPLNDESIILPPDWNFTNAAKRVYQGLLSPLRKPNDGTSLMTLEVIVKNKKNGIGGVLIAEVDLAYIKDLLKGALQYSKFHGLVLDEEGEVIGRYPPEAKAHGVSFSKDLGNDITEIQNVAGVAYLMTSVPLKKFLPYWGSKWTIVLQIPAKEAFAAANVLKQEIISLLLATAFFSIILAFLLGNSFISPLVNLIEGARFIGRGDFDKEIFATSSDEIGELTGTFDEMRINLKNTKADLDYRIMQLSTLYEVGKAISSVLDFHQLQNIILETVVKVMHAEKGSLMLLDEAERILTIGVAVGMSEEIARGTKVGVGESISGYVTETGRPLFVEDVESDHAFLAIKKNNITRGTLMSVPLIAKEKVMGVLNVSRSVPNSFKARDFELFLNLATQASIAIENARLYRYAVTDEMTRLYNHRYFQHRLDEELQRADRYDNMVSLILLDVDHFKVFNDTYGHPEGDRVLKTVSKLIEKSVREVDIVARYGGEEFVVICPEKDGEGSMIPANRIRTTVEGYDFRIDGQRVPINVSLGVATYPTHARNKAELVMLSDTALYYSKKTGRNRATLYTPAMKSDEMLQHKAEKKKTGDEKKPE